MHPFTAFVPVEAAWAADPAANLRPRVAEHVSGSIAEALPKFNAQVSSGMTFRPLDRSCVSADNLCMRTAHGLRVRLCCTLSTLVALGLLSGCQAFSSGGQQQSQSSNGSGVLTVSPSSLNFGSVAVGSSSSLSGTLSASNANVTVSTADWSGTGYSVSGISFPVTIAAGKSANYTVTFAPQASGTANGSVAFLSNASDASASQSFSGSGTGTTSAHTVALSWNPSTSTVAGYNVYRGTQSGGPYSTKLNSALIANTSYTDANVQSGATYYYVATAVDSNNVESAFSNEATAAIP